MTAPSCPECGSSKTFKSGKRSTSEGKLQRFFCKNCNTRFSPNPYKLSLTNSNRQLCAILQEAKNLDPQQKTVVGVNAHQPNQGQIVDFLWSLKKQGYSDATVATRVKILKYMNKKGVNLLDPEAVKLFIAKQETWGNGHRQIAVHAYDGFAEMLCLKWTPPFYENEKSLPFVPLEKEIDALVCGCSTKIAASLLAMKECGMRIGELWRIKWTDLDEEQSTLKTKAEKHGNPRMFKISSKLIAMLNALPKKNEYIFGNTNMGSHRWRFDRQKRALSVKLQNPRLLQIKFHSLRHFKATMEYAKTKDILHVKELLGHKNINSTLVYTQLIAFESQDYYSATANTTKEAKDLIEQGFEYVVTTPENVMLFRKRK